MNHVRSVPPLATMAISARVISDLLASAARRGLYRRGWLRAQRDERGAAPLRRAERLQSRMAVPPVVLAPRLRAVRRAMLSSGSGGRHQPDEPGSVTFCPRNYFNTRMFTGAMRHRAGRCAASPPARCRSHLASRCAPKYAATSTCLARRQTMAKRKSFKCPKCGRTFGMAAHLGRHMSTMHAPKGKRTAPAPTKRRPAMTSWAPFGGHRPILDRLGAGRDELAAQRAALDAQGAALDQAITALGGSVGSVQVHRGGRRPPAFRTGTLPAYIRQVMHSHRAR